MESCRLRRVADVALLMALPFLLGAMAPVATGCGTNNKAGAVSGKPKATKKKTNVTATISGAAGGPGAYSVTVAPQASVTVTGGSIQPVVVSSDGTRTPVGPSIPIPTQPTPGTPVTVFPVSVPVTGTDEQPGVDVVVEEDFEESETIEAGGIVENTALDLFDELEKAGKRARGE